VLTADLRQGEDIAAAATLRAFLNLCGKAGATACAFSAGSPILSALPLGRVAEWQSAASSLQQLWTASASASMDLPAAAIPPVSTAASATAVLRCPGFSGQGIQ
jgi:hypothetical protein